MKTSRPFVASVVLGAFAALAFAGSVDAKIPGGGSAEVKWNPVRFKQQLMDQVSPGLSWRLGSGGASTLETSGCVLLGERCAILPGKYALNLRFIGGDKWELVVFELRNIATAYMYEATLPTYGIIPCTALKEKDPKKRADALDLALRGMPGKDLRKPAVITGEDKGAATGVPAKPAGAAGAVNYSKEALAELDAAPHLEMDVRFGDLDGLIQFECGKAAEAKGSKGEGKDKVEMKLVYAQVPCVRARTECFATEHGEAPLGALVIGKDEAAKQFYVAVRGGAEPQLEPRVIAGPGEPPKSVVGKRVPTKAAPKTLTADMKGNVLTLHLFNEDLVFEL